MITYGNLQCLNQPTNTNRQVIGIDIELNGNTYNWMIYAPLISGDALTDYLNQVSNIVEADILHKEGVWVNHPKTEEIQDPFTGGTQIADIPKDRIVHPTIPDYVEAVARGYSQGQLNSILEELGTNYWQHPQYAKRIIAPIQLILDDVGIKMYGWFQLNNFPIFKINTSVHLYCNEILPEHQAIVDQLQGVIVIQDRP